MKLSRSAILERFDLWLIEWDTFDLDGVMDFMHEDVVFENWNGTVISGKRMLWKTWHPWFFQHGNFRFIKEDLFIDEEQQKATFSWRLEWPSFKKKYLGKPEVRRGVDILYFQNGKIIRKLTYSKTMIEIDAVPLDMELA